MSQFLRFNLIIDCQFRLIS